MWTQGQRVRVMRVKDDQPTLADPVELLELQRKGSNDWEHWLVADQAGKKLLRWITPGSELVAEAPILTPAPPRPAQVKPPATPKQAKATPAEPRKRSRLRAHVPVVQESAEVAEADRQDLWVELAHLQRAITELQGHSDTVDEILLRSGLVARAAQQA